MRNNDAFRKIALLIFIILSITTVVLICLDSKNSASTVIDNNASDFSEGWTVTSEGKELKVNKFPSVVKEAENRIVLTRTLPNVNDKESIIFYSRHQQVRVYVAGKLIYEFGTSHDGRFGRVTGNRYNIVDLESSYSGQEIKIELTTAYESGKVYCPSIIKGNVEDCTIGLIKKDIFSTFCSMLLVVFGFTTIIVHLLVKKYIRYSNDSFVYLGLTILGIGIWSLSESVLIAFMVKSAGQLSMVTFTALEITLIPMILFWREVFKKRFQLVFQVLVILATGLYTVNFGLHVLGILDMKETVYLAHFMYAMVFVIIFIVGMISYKDVMKERTGLLVYGMGIMLVGAGIDAVRYYFFSSIQSSTFTKYGLMIYVFIPIKVIISQLTEQVSLGRKVWDYQKIAYTDSLTGVGNRAAFNHQLATIPQSEYYKYSIVDFDVNDLKRTNDMFGHECGDNLIITAAKTIMETFGPYGNCYRTGGDEFVAILNKVDEQRYEKLVKKMQSFLDGVKLNDKVGVKIASGFAEYMYDTDVDLYSTLRRADEKMYDNKRAMKEGKAQTAAVTEELTEANEDTSLQKEKPELKIVIDDDIFGNAESMLREQTGRKDEY